MTITINGNDWITESLKSPALSTQPACSDHPFRPLMSLMLVTEQLLHISASLWNPKDQYSLFLPKIIIIINNICNDFFEKWYTHSKSSSKMLSRKSRIFRKIIFDQELVIQLPLAVYVCFFPGFDPPGPVSESLSGSESKMTLSRIMCSSVSSRKASSLRFRNTSISFMARNQSTKSQISIYWTALLDYRCAGMISVKSGGTSSN